MPTQISFSNLAVPESVFPVLGEEMIASSKNHLISFRLNVHFNPEKNKHFKYSCSLLRFLISSNRKLWNGFQSG